MDSNKKETVEVLNTALIELVEKVEQLKIRLDVLCRETDGCKQIEKVNKELLAKKESNNGTNIDALREEE